MTEPGDLPPLDPDSGLTRFEFDEGDQIVVYVLAPGEALDASHQLAERGATALPGAWPDSPDEVHVAADGRPVAVYYSTAARRLVDPG